MDRETRIDKRFAIPPFVTNVENDTENGEFQYTYDDDYTIQAGDDIDPDLVWNVPTSFNILSQTIRTTNGRQVVDVVIEVDDQPGVDEYEVRLAQA